MEYPKTHDEAIAIKKAARKTSNIDRMHDAYGSHFPDHCGDCIHFHTLQFANKYFKCDLFKLSHGPSTDWRKFWDACGKFKGK